VIPLGEAHLRKVVAEYVEHYHRERNHQALGNQLIAPIAANRVRDKYHERLDGMLKYYHRDAA
jgi:putative transposase